jgi:branched-chain amino acid transport system substrate-binding protein
MNVIQPRRHGILAAGLVLSLSALTSACGGSDSESADTVKLGQLANLSGYSAAPYGEPFDKGLRLALKDVESSGLLEDTGLSIDLVTEDIASDETKAVTSLNKMQRDGVAAFVLPSHTAAVLAVEPLVNDAGSALLTGTGGEPEPEEDNVFHLGAYATTQQNFAKELVGRGAKRVVAVVEEDNPAFVVMADRFEEGLEGAGSSFVARKSVAADDSNFSALLTSIAADKPDVLFLSTLGEQAGNIISQMQQVDGLKDVQVAGTVAWTKDVAQIAGGDAEGALFPVYWVPSDDKGKEFADKYREEYDEEPATYSGLGYQAGWLMATAILLAAEDGEKITGDAIADRIPEAATSPELKEHGLIEDFQMPESGIPQFPGGAATFDGDGNIVPAGEE